MSTFSFVIYTYSVSSFSNLTLTSAEEGNQLLSHLLWTVKNTRNGILFRKVSHCLSKLYIAFPPNEMLYLFLSRILCYTYDAK